LHQLALQARAKKKTPLAHVSLRAQICMPGQALNQSAG